MEPRTVTKAGKVGLVCIMLLCITLVFGLTGAYAAEKYVMKIGHVVTADINAYKHAQMIIFRDYVNAKSGGRMEVQVYGGGALGGERELVESVMSGSIQSCSVSGALGGFYPSQMIFDIPYLFPSAPVAWEVVDGPFGKKMSADLLKKTGMRNLHFGEVGYRHFTNSKRRIRTPQDMVGLKFRVQENPLYMTLVKSLGGNPTPIPWPEVYMACQSGVVDGQENPISVILTAKLQEVQKYCSLDGHVYGVDWFLVNEKFYQSLPKDLQDLLYEAAKIAIVVERGNTQFNSILGLETMRKAGVDIYSPTASELALFKKASQEPVIQWLKTKVDQKLIDELLKAVEKASKNK